MNLSLALVLLREAKFYPEASPLLISFVWKGSDYRKGPSVDERALLIITVHKNTVLSGKFNSAVTHKRLCRLSVDYYNLLASLEYQKIEVSRAGAAVVGLHRRV